MVRAMKLTADERAVLTRIADGARLQREVSDRIAEALCNRGLLESLTLPSALWWRITDKGRAALAKE
jgi:predicted transcriptional regulator